MEMSFTEEEKLGSTSNIEWAVEINSEEPCGDYQMEND